MREIKFRAWIPDIGIFLEEIAIYKNDDTIGFCDDYLREKLEGKFLINDDEILPLNYYDSDEDLDPVMHLLCGEDWYWIENRQYELEQFTGLKDQNNKEIYEGDIIKSGDDILIVSWNKKHASFCLDKKGWMYSHYFGEAVSAKDCEVIGNIHQNPELIK